MTISSLRRTSSTTTPTCLPPTLTSTRRIPAVDRLQRGETASASSKCTTSVSDVATLAMTFAAHILNLAGTYAANFLDKRQRERKGLLADTHE